MLSLSGKVLILNNKQLCTSYCSYLSHAVLDRSTGEKKPVPTLESKQDLPSHTEKQKWKCDQTLYTQIITWPYRHLVLSCSDQTIHKRDAVVLHNINFSSRTEPSLYIIFKYHKSYIDSRLTWLEIFIYQVVLRLHKRFTEYTAWL